MNQPHFSARTSAGNATLVPSETTSAETAVVLPDATLRPADAAADSHELEATLAPENIAHDATLRRVDNATQRGEDKETQAFHRAALAAAGSFGDYQLLEPIAKGGMGIVYKALQRKLNRIVAIKMILSGHLADQEDVDRFYEEAEAAAALSHPNIVAIHEIGEFEGQHFFSMAYIPGKSLADLVRAHPLPPRRAAEYVRTIAETMQFAHDNGIVHRDLKPSNVLLDKKERPLITDFGLAKRVSKNTDRTLAGTIIGTSSYMPPEQAAGKLDEIGPLSDVYSTGAILFELLTGRPPFRAATTMETIRQVVESEPLSPRLLNPQVPKDLETICLKCLQKPQAARYSSSQALADELGRFLNGVPIQARPISRAARFWRLCKRHPVTSSALALTVFALISAAVVSTSFYVSESIQRGVAERRRDDAMLVVDKFLTKFSDEALLRQPGMQTVRDELYQMALENYQRFLSDAGDNPAVQDRLAKAHFRVGQITGILKSPDEALPSFIKAREMQQRLLDLRRDDPSRMETLANTLMALGSVWTNKRDYVQAQQDFEAAVEVRKKLAGAAPSNSEYQRLLANSYMNVGLALYMSAMRESDPDRFRAKLVKAIERFQVAQKTRLAALAADPENFKLHRDLGKGYYNLGNVCFTGDDKEGAEENYKRAAKEFEAILGHEDAEFDDHLEFATCCGMLGALLRQVEKSDEARPWYQKALARLAPLVQQNPDVVAFQNEQAALLMSLFELESAAGDRASAMKALDVAQGIFSKLAKAFPTVPTHQRDLAIALRELAKQQAELDPAAARENLAQAIDILGRISEQFPDEVEFADTLAETKGVQLTAMPQ